MESVKAVTTWGKIRYSSGKYNLIVFIILIHLDSAWCTYLLGKGFMTTKNSIADDKRFSFNKDRHVGKPRTV